MPKRKSLTKKNVRTAVGASSDRVIVGPRKREIISPGASAQAVEQIERYEASTLRAEQRLGLVRLA